MKKSNDGEILRELRRAVDPLAREAASAVLRARLTTVCMPYIMRLTAKGHTAEAAANLVGSVVTASRQAARETRS